MFALFLVFSSVRVALNLVAAKKVKEEKEGLTDTTDTHTRQTT